jgi:AmmeMemoRadiSam system protein B
VIRRPTVAGLFYPADAGELADTVDALLAEAGSRQASDLRGLVVPHAGYAYSGPVAATAFALAPEEAAVALLGPSHFSPFVGLAVSGADAWATPLGDVPVSARMREAALTAGAFVDDEPHAREHALEVELPFLQRACRRGLEVLPVAVGRTGPEGVARLIEAVDGLVVVSTDLSHYHLDAQARELDRRTVDAVLAREPASIKADAACGVFALRGLVDHARRCGLEIELLDLRTSADAGGGTDRVVGYGAFALRGVA